MYIALLEYLNISIGHGIVLLKDIIKPFKLPVNRFSSEIKNTFKLFKKINETLTKRFYKLSPKYQIQYLKCQIM